MNAPSSEIPYVALCAGPVRVALPLSSIRHIVDAGMPLPAGVEVADAPGCVSLARLLAETPTATHPAILAFEGSAGLLRLSVCKLEDVFRAGAPQPLPPAVLVRWPGLIRGTLRHRGLIHVLDETVLRALIDDDPAAGVARVEPA